MAFIERTKTSPLPPYSELIVEAIEALGEKAGSKKTAISRYLESKYAEQLPDSHYSLMADHLARMKEYGVVVLINNNYFIAGSNAPTPRGRGRPPKAKEASSEVGSRTPMLKRPRGRPPKPKDGSDTTLKSSGPRGRPPKPKDLKDEMDPKEDYGAYAKPEDETITTPKSEGMPSKKAKDDAAPKAEMGLNGSAVKKGRGRLPKVSP